LVNHTAARSRAGERVAMRLYLKLLLLLVVALGIQWSITEQWRRSEWLFAFRCQYARLTRDDQMSDRLLDEARDGCFSGVRKRTSRLDMGPNKHQIQVRALQRGRSR
jgi:hypothetical protein